MADSQKHILYSVLDWGLGHATRSIPVIRRLLEQNAKITLAGEGDSLFLLQETFPQCESFLLKGLQVNYPEKGSMALKMLLSLPSYISSIKKEHEQTQDLVKKLKPDAIISDNRYGVYSDKIQSVFISHQLNIKAPSGMKWMEPFIYRMNKSYIRNFDELWVPDHNNENNITGDLSHNEKTVKELSPIFIGPLSRFGDSETSVIHERYDVLIIISGPEPQRTIFENKCLEQALTLPCKTLVVRGKPQEKEIIKKKNVTLVPHLSSGELKAHLEKSNFIVSRCGHSTIMDLSYLGKTALCVPTPGQTEQEYIAEYLSEKNYLIAQSQNEFNLQEGLQQLSNCKTLPAPEKDLLNRSINEFLNRLKSVS